MDKGKDKFITKKLRAYGIVQGVGFRPLVYRIAKKHNITGYVRNVGGYVEIVAQGEDTDITDLVQELISSSGSHELVKLEIKELGTASGANEFELEDTFELYEDFTITGSGESEEVSIIPPDLPVCPECMKELGAPHNRRYLNPFISCISCGPRYTILEELPYDRHTTAMKDFTMCPDCMEEYDAPGERRFHAQTISCNDCGPYLIFRDNRKSNGDSYSRDKLPGNGIEPADASEYEADHKKMSHTDIGCKEMSRKDMGCKEMGCKEMKQKDIRHKNISRNDLNYNHRSYEKSNYGSAGHEVIKHKAGNLDIFEQEALQKAAAIICEGGIVAVKGIGGYHLVCSPFREDAVLNLRKLKGREEKPFAVMFEHIAQIEEYCPVSDEEKVLLETKARPIVLLCMREDIFAPSTNKGSIYLGAFLPYTPLQLLLIKECGPLIMTSANLSGQPILTDDDRMLSLPSPYLDGVLYNKRKIVRFVDDSVAKVIDKKPQLIRRSRGYVPYPVFLTEKNSRSGRDKEEAVFAAGGDLKAAFCLYKKGNAVVSQHFGDLEEEAVMGEYEKAYSDLTGLLKIAPALAVCDLHPNYHSSEFAKGLNLPVLKVQHHHAHIASVMAEHDLQGKVIGIAFDGTGYGTDGNIWGSEFLLCEGAGFLRAAHLAYAPMLGGDASMRDAEKTAACFLLNAGLGEYVTDTRKDIINAALSHKINTVRTSSMGRLFDAAASILGIAHINKYEGECAALLEKEAVLALRRGVEPVRLSFAFCEAYEIIEIDPKPVLNDLCRLRDTQEAGALALGFHYALAEAAAYVCRLLRRKYQSNTVALSGGVFQNSILSGRTCRLLRDQGFEVYMNLAVPPNDGGISLGQTYIGLYAANNISL